tara:strand:+ start:9006 stop:11096 length:2091 start_codon:yes stop_codon:yes gene_type:complete
MKPAYLLFFLIFYIQADYGWLQDVVGIDIKEFEYTEGSDHELELYTKKSFFTDIKMSPNGKFLAFQSDSQNFTQGILIVDLDTYLDSGIEKATIAKAAVENKPDSDLGVKALFLCNFEWATDKYILLELCGKRIDFVQGEIFFSLGVWKLFNLETKEFKSFIYPLAPAPRKGSSTFEDRYKVATFISRYDDEHILMSVPENKRGYRYANLRKISLTKKGTEPKGENVYVSNVACQYKLKYRSSNFCNQSSIFLLDKNKKPVLTLSSTISSDGKTYVYAHLTDRDTTKIDVDLEEYGIIGIDDNNVWLTGDPSGETFGVSILSLKTEQITRINPEECHSYLGGFSSLNSTAPYAVGMECEGEKDLIVFDQDNRDAQILSNLARSFPGKNIRFGNWTDNNDKALLQISDSSNIAEVFLLDLNEGQLKYIATASNVPKELLHKNESRSFITSDNEQIYGYLTKPKGEIKKLVAYVHGGPHGPRDYDGFDPFEQYLASKGIAILKVNFRGSGGYGKNYEESGYQEWGGLIMDDIATATKEIQEELGISRDDTCVAGASFGGYAALAMSYKYPDVFECAIGMMGVYDLKMLRNGTDDSIYTQQGDEYFEIMEMYLGSDEANLADFSPVFNADKMQTRILMWHGLQDQIAPIVHMDLMKAALEEEGIEYQSFTMSRLGHEYGEAEDMKVHLPVMKNFILGEL